MQQSIYIHITEERHREWKLNWKLFRLASFLRFLLHFLSYLYFKRQQALWQCSSNKGSQSQILYFKRIVWMPVAQWSIKSSKNVKTSNVPWNKHDTKYTTFDLWIFRCIYTQIELFIFMQIWIDNHYYYYT